MDNRQLICSWDFSTMTAFPEDCASHGCSFRGPSVGLELSGPGAFITLPVEMPTGVGSLSSRSLAVCVRFCGSASRSERGLIAIGLDDPDKPQHERLVFGAVNPEYNHFPYWKVDRAGPHEPGRFGFLKGRMENSVNEDIHLVLSVKQDANGGPGAYFSCFRNGRAYGLTTLCSGAANFNSQDQFAVVIKRPEGAGSTVVRYARVFSDVLAEGDILRLGEGKVLSWRTFNDEATKRLAQLLPKPADAC